MILNRYSARTFGWASALLAMAAVTSPVVQAATFVIINTNSAGQGFNDPTPVASVGGNTGTTLGAQRLIAVQAAADFWGARLSSSVTIQVSAAFNPLTCSSTSAVLGSTSPFAFVRDFTGAPVAGTWYPVALANALFGSDLDPSNPDITTQFNSSIGTCPLPRTWYYGLDGNPAGGQIDLFSVVLHELGHGLGFLTVVDLASGSKLQGFNDTFMLNLIDQGASPPDYSSMTDAQRVAASTDTGNLQWVGANVRALSGILTAGAVGDHVRIYAPNPQQPGSSVSHWDKVLTPDQLLEPAYTGPLHNPILELPLLKDIGWTVLMGVDTHNFNQDVNSDILWRDTSGNVAIWEMNGTSVLNPAVTFVGNVPTVWTIVGMADFNGDGLSDILWRDTSGNVAIWEMNGTSVVNPTASFLGNVSTVWSIVGTGDFNGDGKSDILWRDTSGNVAIWEMNGTSVVNSTASFLGNVSTVWSIVGTGDFNGDGKSDILWRDTSGNVVIWEMNGTSVLNPAASFVANVSTVWTIQDPLGQ
jgi:hypothetical protein